MCINLFTTEPLNHFWDDFQAVQAVAVRAVGSVSMAMQRLNRWIGGTDSIFFRPKNVRPKFQGISSQNIASGKLEVPTIYHISINKAYIIPY